MLSALATKGHSVAEIAGAARAMRERALKIPVPEGAKIVDIVGTGGTGISTFNVSTTTCFVAAGAGAKVAKHGNVTNTRASGSADVLTALGVKIDASPEIVTRCIDEAGIGFCFARSCHPAMKNVAPVRKELGVKTFFNMLGPMVNPSWEYSPINGPNQSQRRSVAWAWRGRGSYTVMTDRMTSPLRTPHAFRNFVRVMWKPLR